ncbi:DUF3105 domain-containing protein [Deinococcus frigens]|uniref:DUF3105 domain-containing protein n=1 Tax=Deinococcus frigens TaxID=249403 RepID=UPI000A580605|nr:DUF3105 domain-containing protein [Deinococcus frigens]
MSKPANVKFNSAPPRRNLWPAALVGAVALLLVGAAWWGRSGADTGGLGQTFANQGQEHIAVGTAHPAYNSFPATSGWHYVQPQPWGTFAYMVEPERLIHNLEHGGIVIQYNPALLQGTEGALDGIQRRFPNKTVVAPNEALKVPVAVTAWRRLYTLDSVDETRIVAFIERYKNRAPERFPD